MNTKRRLSASVDAELLEAAESATSQGRVASVSAWVNDALRLKAENDRRLRALEAFIDTYEAKHGVIGDAEMERAARGANARAVAVRGLGTPRPARTRSNPRSR